MQTVYLVMTCNQWPSGSDYVVAVYTNREAADLHVQMAEQEAHNLHAAHIQAVRANPSPWPPVVHSSWDHRCGNYDDPPEYTVQPLLLCDHPDQWQEARGQ